MWFKEWLYPTSNFMTDSEQPLISMAEDREESEVQRTWDKDDEE